MLKSVISLITIVLGLVANAQLQRIISPNVPPVVLSKNHIVINGETIIGLNETKTYYADFFYPNETSNIEWTVLYGTIIGQNTNPALGAVYVTVLWDGNVPHSIPSHIPADAATGQNVFGGVAIKQGTHSNGVINQASYLKIYRKAAGTNQDPIVCNLAPRVQNVNYLQQPCLITGVQNCISPGNPHSYRWAKWNSSIANWEVISGALSFNYQPPAITQNEWFTRTVRNHLGTESLDQTGAQINLNAFNPGTLYCYSTVVNYGESPIIYDEMPYGGSCQSGNYVFSWEVSYNGKPWQLLNTGFVHFHGIPGGLTKNNVRIRRKVTCGATSLYSNTLEFTYQSSYTQEPGNYIRENRILTKGIESWEDSESLPTGQKIQSSMYSDGFGKSYQKVDKELGAPSSANPAVIQDVVTIYANDEYGRVQRNYLPFASAENPGKIKTNVFTVQSQYYQQFYNETSPYQKNTFEANPLDRVQAVNKAGAIWQNNAGADISYLLSEAAEDIKKWRIDFTSGSLPYIDGVYATGDLYKTVTKDENLHQVIEYKDKSGNLILKKVQQVQNPGPTYTGWLSTYYIYDDLGLLRYTIVPKAVESLIANGWVWDNTKMSELCYYNEYDSKGRVIVKRTPQGEKIEYVYDKRGRLVLTQDGNQQSDYYQTGSKKWTFMLYDELDREIANGLLNSPSSRAALQQLIENGQISTGNTTVTVSLGPGHSENVSVFDPVVPLGSSPQFNGIIYYDSYNYPNNKPFNNSHAIPTSSDPNVDAISSSQRTVNMVTGSRTRILDNTNRIFVTTLYYDEQSRNIQTLTDNIKNGTDITTYQFDFSGKVIHKSLVHSAPGTPYSNFTVLTLYTYDQVGRLQLLSKKFGTAHMKELVHYSYDDFSRLKKKRLGVNPSTGGNEIETLEYSYNINGQLSGINKFYALKSAGLYNKWNNYFGMYLEYDNKDGVFSKRELNGNISGIMWNTRGDDEQRRYEFYYDPARQLTNANFTQKDLSSGSWLNNKMDFTTTGLNGKINYDANGNITALMHYGVIPGASPLAIDDLRYTYADYSNKLTRIQDMGTAGSNNGLFGDFKDGTNAVPSADYDYDKNGNLVTDLNKNVTNLSGARGVKYNFLDKVEEAKIEGKGTISFVYDAAGSKLQRIFSYRVGRGTATKSIFYCGDFVYTDEGLQYVNFEEGRLRVITPVSLPYKTLTGALSLPDNKMGVFDYFVTDHLGNTRMVLTDEQQWAEGKCTVDDPADPWNFGAVVDNGYGQFVPAPNNEVNATKVQTPSPWQANGNPSQYCSGLRNSDGKRIGPNVILKVMAGDEIYADAIYYYQTNAGQPGTILNDLATSLISAISSGNISAIVKGANLQTSHFTGSTPFGSYISQLNNGNVTSPRAYLNIVYLDEQFNFVGSAQPLQVSTAGPGLHRINASAVINKAPKNGYAYVFLSNESADYVYFDNLVVSHTRGRILEESHYYPYGMKIAAISSRKLGDPENGHTQNRHSYQGVYCEIDDDLGWNEFDLRNYDPQIGRWTGVDPNDEFASPYLGMGNNPVINIDPDGGFTGKTGGIWGAVGGFVAGTVIAKLTGNSWGVSLLYGIGGSVLGASIGYAWGESMTDNTGFGKNFRSFYEGLVDDPGYVYDRHGYSVANPKIWKSVQLFEWVEDEENRWEEDISSRQVYVSADVTPRGNEMPMTRTQVGPPSTDNFFQTFNLVTDVITGTLPQRQVPTRTIIQHTELWQAGTPGVFGSFTVRPTARGAQISINGNPAVPLGSQQTFTNVLAFNIVISGNIGTAPGLQNTRTQTRVVIRTFQRNTVPIQKLKFLGITIKKRTL